MSKNYNKKILSTKYDTWFDYFKDVFIHSSKEVIFISDCDGILTDGRSYFKDEKELKSYCSLDKEAVKFIVDYQLDEIIFVSGDKEGFHITNNRIKNFFDSCKNNTVSCLNFNSEERVEAIYNLKQQNPDKLIVFIGDAYSDIKAMSCSDYSLTVKNSPDEVKQFCDYSSDIEGGHGGFADCIFWFYKNILGTFY